MVSAAGPEVGTSILLLTVGAAVLAAVGLVVAASLARWRDRRRGRD